ncbi:MAG: VOC family protein [Rhodobacteraceae bacterium]|nr:VOC family protein [Alphaproteobacteria bacterium]NNF71716.1 VOC family protein [Paracoccaceae bacterium]NNK68218.1 VOC family protein [Paracoccaceae bacterium]
MTATLEHLNITVRDARATAAWMERLFDWHIRWEGPSLDSGHTVHVGDDSRYVALYTPKTPVRESGSSYVTSGGFNHLAVVVDDLDAMEERVKAEGFKTGNHADYEPGRRFYFHDHEGIEVEVVSYA